MRKPFKTYGKICVQEGGIQDSVPFGKNHLNQLKTHLVGVLG